MLKEKNYSKWERAKSFIKSHSLVVRKLLSVKYTHSTQFFEEEKSSKRTWACACRQCLTFAIKRCVQEIAYGTKENSENV